MVCWNLASAYSPANNKLLSWFVCVFQKAGSILSCGQAKIRDFMCPNSQCPCNVHLLLSSSLAEPLVIQIEAHVPPVIVERLSLDFTCRDVLMDVYSGESPVIATEEECVDRLRNSPVAENSTGDITANSALFVPSLPV